MQRSAKLLTTPTRRLPPHASGCIEMHGFAKLLAPGAENWMHRNTWKCFGQETTKPANKGLKQKNSQPAMQARRLPAHASRRVAKAEPFVETTFGKKSNRNTPPAEKLQTTKQKFSLNPRSCHKLFAFRLSIKLHLNGQNCLIKCQSLYPKRVLRNQNGLNRTAQAQNIEYTPSPAKLFAPYGPMVQRAILLQPTHCKIDFKLRKKSTHTQCALQQIHTNTFQKHAKQQPHSE